VELMTTVQGGVRWVALAIELLAVAVIAVSILIGTVDYVRDVRAVEQDPSIFRRFRARLGRGLLLGLEMLVAADVIRTIALEATLENVAVLGLLVLVRTFLAWSLEVEIEGRWPWQARRTPRGEDGAQGQIGERV
jgi:uncharacterized membrane protein